MKIKITFDCEKLPIFYRNRFLAFIKQAVNYSVHKADYFERDKPRVFTYCVSFGKRDIKKEWITLSEDIKIKDSVFYPKNGTVDLYISSTDINFLMLVVKGFECIKYFEFSQDNSFKVNGRIIILKVLKIEPVIQKPIESDSIVMRSHSPIFFEDQNSKPVTFLDDNFKDQVNQSMRNIFNLLGLELKKDLEIESVDMKIIVVKHTFSHLIKSSIPFFSYKCSDGYFKISGHQKDLDIIRNIGLGNKTGMGFGMVEVV